MVARELGRRGEPTSFHSDLLAAWLGHEGPGRATVGFHVDDGVADFVAHARGAAVVLLRTAPDAVAPLDLGAPTVVLHGQPGLDDPDQCRIVFAPDVLGPAQRRDVDGARARAAVVLAADAVGAAEAALDAIVARVSEREVWGAPLGALQAVQHRCADMAIDVTLAADAVFDAAAVIDRGASPDEVLLAAAHAKVTAVERARRVTAGAHQLAGGQGVLLDAPFHRWYRRVKAAEPVLGTSRHHRAVLAHHALARRRS